MDWLRNCVRECLTHFWPMFPKNTRVSGVFRGYKIGTLARNGLQNFASRGEHSQGEYILFIKVECSIFSLKREYFIPLFKENKS